MVCQNGKGMADALSCPTFQSVSEWARLQLSISQWLLFSAYRWSLACLSGPMSPIYRILSVCGVPRPLDPLQTVELLMAKAYTERDAESIRSFFCALPPVKVLSQASWSLLERFPKISVLKFNSDTWESQSSVRFKLSSSEGRHVQCAKLGLQYAVQSFLESSIEGHVWPTIASLSFHSDGSSLNTLLFS